jgi:hypothetical protein
MNLFIHLFYLCLSFSSFFFPFSNFTKQSCMTIPFMLLKTKLKLQNLNEVKVIFVWYVASCSFVQN